MPCVACTYMPNASWRRRGGKAQGEGYLPSGAKRRTSEAKVCTSAARKTVGKPLVLRQGRALSEVWFPYSCASAHRNFGVALRQEQAAVVGGERRGAAEDRRGVKLLPAETGICHLPNGKRSREDRSRTGTHRPGVSKPHNTQARCCWRAEDSLRLLRSGSCGRMSRPLKLKVHGAVCYRLSNSPIMGL